MRQVTSTFTDTITVHAGDQHLQIAPGDAVDLDAPIGDGTTLADHLGDLASGFVAVEAAEEVKKTDQPKGAGKPDSKKANTSPAADAPADKE